MKEKEWVTSEMFCPKCGRHTEELIENIGRVEYVVAERCLECKWTIDNEVDPEEA